MTQAHIGFIVDARMRYRAAGDLQWAWPKSVRGKGVSVSIRCTYRHDGIEEGASTAGVLRGSGSGRTHYVLPLRITH